MATPDALQLFGVTLVGATPENGRKLLLTLALIVIALLFSRLARGLLAASGHNLRSDRIRFWLRQAVGLLAGLIVIFGIVSVWFDDPTRLTTGLGPRVLTNFMSDRGNTVTLGTFVATFLYGLTVVRTIRAG